MFQDATGRPLYVVSVNGWRLAPRDCEALLADVETVAEALSDHDTPPATVSGYSYETSATAVSTSRRRASASTPT
jgi:hypothetical protein